MVKIQVNSSGKAYYTSGGKVLLAPVANPNIQSLNVTPTTSAQTITASGGVDGYSPISVSAVTSSIDANITAGNIKKNVTILGVTGTYEGSGGGGGGGSDLDFKRVIDGNGNLTWDSAPFTFTLPSTVTDITGNNALYYMFYGFNQSFDADLSNIESVSGDRAMYGCFCYSRITSLDLSGLKTATGSQSLYYLVQGCNYLTSVDLSSLQSVTNGGLAAAFNNTNLTTLDLSSLETASGSSCLNALCSQCNSLTSVDLSSLETASGDYCLGSSFSYCPYLTSVDLSSLETASGRNVFSNAFTNTTSLQTMSFPSLAVITGYRPFENAFSGSGVQYVYFGALGTQTITENLCLYHAFTNANSLSEIHFRADSKNAIEALYDYSNKFGAPSSATIYFDIGGAVLNFNLTPSIGNTIYINGVAISGTSITTGLEDKTAIIYNSSYPLVIKHYTNLQPEQIINTTVDLANESTSNYIELQVSESGATVVFTIDGVNFQASSVSGNNHRLNINTDSAINVSYSVSKTGFATVTNTVNYTGTSQTITVTMTAVTTRTVDLQYPFTTDRSYLQYLIYDGNQGWYDGSYKIAGGNYEAIVDDHYENGPNYDSWTCNGYITFTTGGQGGNLIINVNVKEYYEASAIGIYVSKTMPHFAGINDYYDDVFDNDNWDGDGGHWLHSWDYMGTEGQDVDYTEVLDANTTYYISFCYLIDNDYFYESEPEFRINRIRFDIEE